MNRHAVRIRQGRLLIKIASEIECDIVLNALVGMSGLEPTYNALLQKKTVALANKETLVAGGDSIMDTASRSREDSPFFRWTVNTAQSFSVWKDLNGVGWRESF